MQTRELEASANLAGAGSFCSSTLALPPSDFCLSASVALKEDCRQSMLVLCSRPALGTVTSRYRYEVQRTGKGTDARYRYKVHIQGIDTRDRHKRQTQITRYRDKTQIKRYRYSNRYRRCQTQVTVCEYFLKSPNGIGINIILIFVTQSSARGMFGL